MALESGSRLGPYEVEGLLGSGGMGDVYRARDPRLDREVAIKVLPGEIARDPRRLRRFEQEARAAGALNHPNILDVHDIGIHEDAPYVVSELLEGQTLRIRLEGGALPMRKALDYALQIARGLAAVHDRGIVHQDLKPEKIFITEDGRVKILDFGLAKLTRPGLLGQGGERRDAETTELGMVMGTAGYMSPEQVRGEEADHRSDVFSFGAVLYEMLSGQRAFRRDTAAETMNAILKEDPLTLPETGRGIPQGLAHIVERCLEKRAGERFDTAHDLGLALEVVWSEASGRARPAAVRRRRLFGVGALVVLTGLAGVGRLGLNRSREPEVPPSPVRIRTITSGPGPELTPALSSQGDLLAYVWARERREDLYVKLIDGGEPLLVSEGEEDGSTAATLGANGFAPAWSPDGRHIAFYRHMKTEDGQVLCAIFLVPALGGAERRLAATRIQRSHGLSWSPDGQTLAFIDSESPEEPDAIFLLSYESGERRRLTTPPAGHLGDFLPRFSPDGRTLAFGRSGSSAEGDIYLVPVDGGGERRLTVQSTHLSGLDWAADGRSVIFSASASDLGGLSRLWRVPVSGGASEPLDFGEMGHSPALSRKGGRLAYVRSQRRQMDIWRGGGPSASGDDRSPTRLISSTQAEFHPSYSPDGQQIAFASKRSGASEVWICNSDGSNPRQVTFLNDREVWFPSWSPDGEQIAFSSNKEGSFDVYVVSVSGGVPRRLTTGPARDISSSWSRDGLWIYFASNRSGRMEVWKASREGDEPLQVTTRGGFAAAESQDGRFLYFRKARPCGAPPGIWRIPRDGGEEVQVLDDAVSANWALLGESILYMPCASGPPILELLDLTAGVVSRLGMLSEDSNRDVPGLSVSPDGRWVVYVVDKLESDIVLVEGFR